MSEPRPFDDDRMEAMMGLLLRGGVLLASCCVLIGGILFLIRHAGQPVNYRTFIAQTSELHSARGLLTEIARGRAEAIIQLGVLMLIATPIARVIFAAYAFAMERDRLYLVISLIVLVVLMIGLHSS